jgi:hypothetical protein
MILWRIYFAGDTETNLGVYVKWPIFLSGFNQILSFSTDFRKSLQCQFSTEIRPVEATLINANRRTDVAKLIGAFRDCTNALKTRTEYIRVFYTIIIAK